MTNSDIMKIAMQQSAIDCGCTADDFLSHENKIVISKADDNARKYLKLPFIMNLVSYGNNIVASVSPEFKELAEKYISRPDFYHCFETPNIYQLNQMLEPFDASACFMAEYWLPDTDNLKPLECGYKTKILTKEDFTDLYTGEWSNALSNSRKHLDVLGVGAYDEDKLVGLAGCSADCEDMWQIGVDVLPEYRLKGIASSLTSKLASEILKRNKVPFYCCAWSNIRSAKNAIKSGFRPAWVELTVKSNEFIKEMNK